MVKCATYNCIMVVQFNPRGPKYTIKEVINIPTLMNLVGQEFGDWKVIEKLPSRKGETYWSCQCKYCGKIKTIGGSSLRDHKAANCCTNANNNKTKICPLCGKEFTTIYRGWTRKFCFDCSPRYDKNDLQAKEKSMATLRKSIKRYLINYKGGKCCKCGYNQCLEALQFHHLNPEEKSFKIADRINAGSYNLDILKSEVDKCIVLCANCHFELHNGYWQIEDINII